MRTYHPFNKDQSPEIPEARAQNYVIDVFCERTGSGVYYVNDASIEELRDLVCHYHARLEEVKRVLDSAKEVTDAALGYDEL